MPEQVFGKPARNLLDPLAWRCGMSGSGFYLRRAALIQTARNWTGPQVATALPAALRGSGIEAFVYRRELPKSPHVPFGPGNAGSPMVSIQHIAGTNAKVDHALLNRFGLVPDVGAKDYPHPDAFIAHDLMTEVEKFAIEIPEDWNALSDMADLGPAVADANERAIAALFRIQGGREVLRVNPASLIRHALLGDEPDWLCERPELKLITHDNGRHRWTRSVVIESTTVTGRTVSQKPALPAPKRQDWPTPPGRSKVWTLLLADRSPITAFIAAKFRGIFFICRRRWPIEIAILRPLKCSAAGSFARTRILKNRREIRGGGGGS